MRSASATAPPPTARATTSTKHSSVRIWAYGRLNEWCIACQQSTWRGSSADSQQANHLLASGEAWSTCCVLLPFEAPMPEPLHGRYQLYYHALSHSQYALSRKRARDCGISKNFRLPARKLSSATILCFVVLLPRFSPADSGP